MNQIKISIKNQLKTDNLLYQCFDTSSGEPPQMEIVEDSKVANNAFSKFGEQDFFLNIQASDGKNITIDFVLKKNMMDPKGKFDISLGNQGRILNADVNGVFSINVDDEETSKQLKKIYKSGKIIFYITNIGLKKESNDPYSFDDLSGKIEAGDWENKQSWPLVDSYESELFSGKPSPVSTKNNLSIPIAYSSTIQVEKSRIESIKSAIKNDPQIRISLAIPGGSNGFLVKSSELTGHCKFVLSKDKLTVKIDAIYQIKIDSWIKKYKDKAPFIIELDGMLDANGEIYYFGDENVNGYYDPVNLGNVSI